MMQANIHGKPMSRRGNGRADWVDEDRVPITPDETEAEAGERVPVFYRSRLAGVDASSWALRELADPGDDGEYGPANGNAYPAWGGDLARYLFPKVIAHERKRIRRSTAGGVGLAAAAADGRRRKGADRLAARLPDGSVRHSSRGRHADAELPHVERRGEQAGQLLRRDERRRVPVRVQPAAAAELPDEAQSRRTPTRSPRR